MTEGTFLGRNEKSISTAQEYSIARDHIRFLSQGEYGGQIRGLLSAVYGDQPEVRNINQRITRDENNAVHIDWILKDHEDIGVNNVYVTRISISPQISGDQQYRITYGKQHLTSEIKKQCGIPEEMKDDQKILDLLSEKRYFDHVGKAFNRENVGMHKDLQGVIGTLQRSLLQKEGAKKRYNLHVWASISEDETDDWKNFVEVCQVYPDIMDGAYMLLHIESKRKAEAVLNQFVPNSSFPGRLVDFLRPHPYRIVINPVFKQPELQYVRLKK